MHSVILSLRIFGSGLAGIILARREGKWIKIPSFRREKPRFCSGAHQGGQGCPGGGGEFPRKNSAAFFLAIGGPAWYNFTRKSRKTKDRIGNQPSQPLNAARTVSCRPAKLKNPEICRDFRGFCLAGQQDPPFIRHSPVIERQVLRKTVKGNVSYDQRQVVPNGVLPAHGL